MIRRIIHIFLLLIGTSAGFAQSSEWDLDGQLSFFGAYLPDAERPWQTGLRYIPELTFTHPIDSARSIDAEISLNMYGANSVRSWEDVAWTGDINPYRIWLRYAASRWEARAGLQKIDFGSAAALRPLQWFNQIDPRDPLQITNGVYGLLGRYYFLDNTNIWVWGLYGNKERRGLDALGADGRRPEFGGRIQTPIPRGEMALSYHHREADLSTLSLNGLDRSAEDRIGFDAKWDVEIGLWVEASYAFLREPAEAFKNQLFSTVGLDYTFGLGNGLNVILEHLLYSFDEQAFAFAEPGQFTASILSYPISFDDQISSVLYYNWKGEQFSFFVNYRHQFSRLTAYLMAFYIPEGQTAFQHSAWINAFSGPGVRFMLVYNH